MRGTLMDKATEQPLQDSTGAPIVKEKRFTAGPDGSGTEEMSFELDGSTMAGKTVVAFEEAYLDGVVVAGQRDINDEGQTVYFPDLHTNAYSGTDGEKEVLASKKTVIVDRLDRKRNDDYNMSN